MLMAKYDFTIFNKLTDFVKKVPQDTREQLQALIEEGKLVASSALQMALDAADTAVVINGSGNEALVMALFFRGS